MIAWRSILCSSWAVPPNDLNSPRKDLRDGVGAVVEGVVITVGIVVTVGTCVGCVFLGVLLGFRDFPPLVLDVDGAMVADLVTSSRCRRDVAVGEVFDPYASRCWYRSFGCCAGCVAVS